MAGLDQASLAYTQLPVPAELTVKPSCIPDAGLGVFANRFIPRGVRMGSYEGKKVDKADMGDLSTTDYTWEVCFMDRDRSVTRADSGGIQGAREPRCLTKTHALRKCLLSISTGASHTTRIWLCF